VMRLLSALASGRGGRRSFGTMPQESPARFPPKRMLHKMTRVSSQFQLQQVCVPLQLFTPPKIRTSRTMRNPLVFLIAIVWGTAVADTTGSPKSTLVIEHGLATGFSPKPTAKALLGVHLHNLFERQAGIDTCGYYSGPFKSN
jgi:hypothetical protein